ncbi:SLC13 family permease [Agaribacterium haliotis]|uniref:SLC13 family permease n=1 Tax=Agaribacterium haliotis TaxID=2013869 RepID=UPI000BB55C34|nr:DASS family sodium-coupled anion symporter [Agaribacterium haliotis]
MRLNTNQKIMAAAFVALVIMLVELIGIPGFELTRAQEITAAILIIAAVLWISEWVPLFVVSFLILALEIVWLLPSLKSLELATSNTIFYSAFFSDIILLFLGGFVLSSLMQKYGLDLKFAQAILKRTGGHANLTLLGIILACAFLSMWISNTATTAMMLTIVFPLIKRIPSEHPFRIALVLSIPFACNIGGIGTPIGTPPNAIALSYLAQLDISLSFAQWMMLTMPFLVFFLVFLWQLLARLYPAKGLVLSIESRHEDEFSVKHGAALAVFVVTALGWFFGKQLGLSTGTVALFPVVVCFWFGLLDTADFRKLPWDILYIISGGLALGIALKSSGLDSVIVSSLPSEPVTIMLVGVLLAAVMSTVMSNTATAGLVIPLVMSLDISTGLIVALVVSLAMTCSMAMALPVTTPPNAIAFSSQAVRGKDMMLAGGIMTVVGVAAVILFGRPYWVALIGA